MSKRDDGDDLMLNWDTCTAIERHPDKVSGTWVFRGTRVPVYALFENLREGASTEEFLDWFHGVEEWQVKAVLDHESKALRSHLKTRTAIERATKAFAFRRSKPYLSKK